MRLKLQPATAEDAEAIAAPPAETARSGMATLYTSPPWAPVAAPVDTSQRITRVSLSNVEAAGHWPLDVKADRPSGAKAAASTGERCPSRRWASRPDSRSNR